MANLDTVWQGDCLELLPLVSRESVDLVFADPPFNIGYDYDIYRDRRIKEEYLEWTDRWLEGVQQVLKPTGSLFVAIGDEYAAEMKIRLDALGFSMRNWIIWHYTFGVNCTRKFNRSHAHIFYYVVDPKRYTFNPDTVRVASARQTTYADARANPAGKLPDDTWVLRPQESGGHFKSDDDTWAIPRVCGTFRERTSHPCQMPEAVLDRIIRVSTEPGDQVLDPFAGSGTTLAVAKRLGRRFLGMELSDRYVLDMKERLSRITPTKDVPTPRSVPRTPGADRTRAAGLKPR